MLSLRNSVEIREHVGQELGTSEWHAVTQEAIDAFADVTADHQFIHVDPERSRNTPFGGTIAHGFYTLSLSPAFIYKMISFEGFAFAANYGLNRVRFPSPLPVGSQVRLHLRLVSVDETPGGLQLTLGLTFERQGAEKPVCVAESLVRLYTH